LVIARICKGNKQNGERCRQAPIAGRDYCFWHDPEHEADAAEARRLGGLRRRREGTLQGAYDLEGLDSVPALRRLLEVAVMDTLGLENSVVRNRTIISGVLAAAKLLEVGEQEERLAAIEAALGPRLVKRGS
jgi:hypothetical protein